MPKRVDHQERRRHIAGAVARIAIDRGLQGVTFRDVATDADMSVSLVQHYFGTKAGLLIGTLDIQSAALSERITGTLAALGPAAQPLDQLRTILQAFLPTDEESQRAMLVYHAFSAAALTDASLRHADAFQNATSLLGFIATQLVDAQSTGDVNPTVVPELEAQALLALVLGLSLGVLLDQIGPELAETVLDAHLMGVHRVSFVRGDARG